MTHEGMKTKEDIQKRLEKLRLRYLRQYVSKANLKSHENCVYNLNQAPLNYKPEVPLELSLAPRVSTTLLVIQPESPIRLCMYGSENPSTWSGDICNDDIKSSSCPYFKPITEESSVVDSFNDLLKDDEFVANNYKDIAALQWVIDDRIHRTSLSVVSKFVLFVDNLFRFFKNRFSRKTLVNHANTIEDFKE
jgi:hypothetical protein